MCRNTRENSLDSGCSSAAGASDHRGGVRAKEAIAGDDVGVVDQRVVDVLVGIGKLASLAPMEAGFVHELNNQVTFMTLAVSRLDQGLREWDELTEEQREALRKLTRDIGHTADHMRGRAVDFRQLLTVMRGSLEQVRGEGKVSGHGYGSMPFVDVSQVVQLVVGLTRAMHRRDIEVHVRCEQMELQTAGIWQVAAVLGNVLSNAFESFTLGDGQGGSGVQAGVDGAAGVSDEEGGAGAREGTERGIWVTCGGYGQGIRLVVRDNGSGMGAEVCARVFEPLFTTRGGHLGLGLTIARGIVRGLGGGMTLESELGRGTVVTVDLP